MREAYLGLRVATCMLWLGPALYASAAPVELNPTPDALVQAIDSHRVVLLGEVHDNAPQHALRAAALRQWIGQGARPAIVFEQFDRERQPDIDRARRERPADADYLIAQAKGSADWHWDSYRPFVALALEYHLPIVAANLSRSDAMRVAKDGWDDLFDPATRRALALDALPADLWRKHEDAIAAGHCNLLPTEHLPALARAQMARDIVMAESIRPYLDQGVVLLAGNGHVRRDIGVRFWLPADAARGAISIGMLERDDGSESDPVEGFDAYVITERAQRADPCIGLGKDLKPATSR